VDVINQSTLGCANVYLCHVFTMQRIILAHRLISGISGISISSSISLLTARISSYIYNQQPQLTLLPVQSAHRSFSLSNQDQLSDPSNVPLLPIDNIPINQHNLRQSESLAIELRTQLYEQDFPYPLSVEILL
jgi:hypothetical protein